MSARLAIVAEPDAAGLAGLDGEFEWGGAVTVTPETAPPAADLVVALGVAEAQAADVRWLDGAAPGPAGAAGARLVAAGGDGLWSRAPWPVRDELFAAPPPPDGAGLLVVSRDEERDAPLLTKLADRGIAFATTAALAAEELLAAAVVAFAPAPNEAGKYVPGTRGQAVPARAFAALAARRPLVLPRARVTFGLLPGVDHLAASTDDDAVQCSAALLAHPHAFATQVALGAIAAERRRASIVYARLAAELATG